MEWWGASMARYSPYVQDYLDRVTAADVAAGNTQGLESGVADAFAVAIEGLVGSAMLGVSGGVISQAASKIKAMPFMCGARTLPGCLVPVVGPAPTNFNFVSGDYDRKTGLLGNPGSTKYLNSNISGLLLPQNNSHFAVYGRSFDGDVKMYLGCQGFGVSNGGLFFIGSNLYTEHQIVDTRNTGFNSVGRPSGASFIGASRDSGSTARARCAGNNYTAASTSTAPSDVNFFVFGFNRNGSVTNLSAAQLSYYSLGESLDLAVLDARISTLMATLAAVIP
jgi:hypothetical protein